ncbi:MAG: response regulator [Thiohalomonadales bacterium]
MMKILIADDHSVVRTGLKYVLEALTKEVVIHEASDYFRALSLAQEHDDLDLIILDLAMPGLEELEAITALRKIIPATPIVIFSAAEDSDTIAETIKKGAQGFIPKSSSRETVLAALNTVLAGDVYLPDSVKNSIQEKGINANWNYRDPVHRDLKNEKIQLTNRQREVLLLIVQGESNTDIAETLHLTLATIKTHIANLFQILGVNNRSQAAYKARKMGLIRKENALSE